MIGAVLAFGLSTQFQVKLPLKDYILPPVGGQREIALGPIQHIPVVMGLFGEHVTGTAIGSVPNPKQAINYDDIRLGNMSYAVKRDSNEGKPCWLIETDGQYNQFIKKHPLFGDLELTNKCWCNWWVDDNGHILRQTYRISIANGDYTMDAIYLKDSLAVLLKDPDHAPHQVTMFPGCGMEGLDMMFKPMIDKGHILMRQKEYYTLDPFTGGAVKCTATINGHFSSPFANQIYEGLYVDLDTPAMQQKAFISYEGEFMKLEIPNNKYLTMDMVPEEKPHIRHKDFPNGNPLPPLPPTAGGDKKSGGG